MQVQLLPAAPLPGGVKVARRPVKPTGVGASPTLAASFQGVMSAVDGLVRNREAAGATPATLTSLRCPATAWQAISDGWQSSNAPVPKTERASGLRGCNSYTIRQFQTLNERSPMRSVIPYQSPLPFRKSCKSNRLIRIRPAVKPQITFRPMRRFGVKPQTGTRLVAQKQSTRLITGRRRSITCRDDQLWPCASTPG